MSGLELAHPDDVDMLRATITDGAHAARRPAAPRRGCATATARGAGST